MLEIFGAKKISGACDIQKIVKFIQDYAKNQDIIIQLFNADHIYGKDHLLSAFEHAQRAFEQKNMIADTLSMEILLYASGEYQIMNGLAKLGIKEDSNNFVFIISGNASKPDNVIDDLLLKFKTIDLELKRDDTLLIGDPKTLEQLGITSEELASIPKERWLELVLEKVALLDIKK